MKVIYVIGPFRAPTPYEVRQNIRAAEQVGLEVARLGAMPMIPHMNTANFDGQLTARFWIEGTLELASRCDAAITVEALGYSIKGSKGSEGEIAQFGALRRPVFRTLSALRAWLESAQ